MRRILFLIFLVLSPAASAYDRIVSTRPNVTEILFSLGLGDRVVGVTQFCRYPEAAQKITKIGGYQNRSFEKILSLRPDLVVIAPDATTAKLEVFLERAGIAILKVPSDSLADIYASIRTIARANEVTEAGEALIRKIQKDLQSQHEAIASLPRKKTMIVLQQHPLIAAGPSTFLGEILNLAGGDNIVSSKLPYPQLSFEFILERRPDVILDIDSTQTSKPIWSGPLVTLAPDLFIPGPRVGEALAQLIRALHSQS
jgi:iron complex transport system substrate-binding protein